MRRAKSGQPGWLAVGAGLGLIGGAYYYIWHPWFSKTMGLDKVYKAEEARKQMKLEEPK